MVVEFVFGCLGERRGEAGVWFCWIGGLVFCPSGWFRKIGGNWEKGAC